MTKNLVHLFYTSAIIILLVYILYQTFSSSVKLKDAKAQINLAKHDIELAKDSLKTAQKRIYEVIRTLERTENELQILKTERKLIVLRERKKLTGNRVELEAFKMAIKLMEAKNDSLKQVAKKFAL